MLYKFINLYGFYNAMIINIKPFIPYNSAYTTTVQPRQESNTSLSIPLKNTYSGADILSTYNRVSFKGNDPTNPDLPAILKYIEKIKQQEGIICSFNQLDLDKIKNICADIPVFSHLTARDLKLISTNFDTILLHRGCYHQCSHCGVNAEPKITIMRWENFVDFVDGTETLIERLGFNPFLDFYDTYSLPYLDSDPMIYRSKDLKGNIHSIFDAAKYYYAKTGNRFYITTAGWNKSDKIAQMAAENFVKYPECIEGFAISIHPFHRYMQESIKHLKEGNLEKSAIFRNKYIDMISNVINTTIELNEYENYGIILEFLDETLEKGIIKEASKKLLSDILQKVPEAGLDKIDIEERNIDLIGRANGSQKDVLENSKSLIEFDIYDLLTSVKMLGPDGQILIRPDSKKFNFEGEPFMELPYKLNFRLPTRDLSTPIKKVILKVL